MVKRREDLSAAAGLAAARLRLRPEAFGRFSESIARYLGTARFLVCQSGVIVIWIAYNTLAPDALAVRPVGPRSRAADPRAVAAGVLRGAVDPARPEPSGGPRPCQQSENDREVADRTKTDTEFLAREIAGVRLMLADVVTGEELREQLAELTAAIDAAVKRLETGPGRSGELVTTTAMTAGFAAERGCGAQPVGMPVNSCRRTPWREHVAQRSPPPAGRCRRW